MEQPVSHDWLVPEARGPDSLTQGELTLEGFPSFPVGTAVTLAEDESTSLCPTLLPSCPLPSPGVDPEDLK